MNIPSTAAERLGALLADTHARGAMQVTVPPELEPKDGAAAYLAQHAFLRRRHLAIGGWKIGAKTPDGPIQGAPLPASGIHPDGVVLARDDVAVFGIEVEIMFRFGRDFLPGATAADPDQVLASIAAIGTSIEIVSSRLAGWPDAPKLVQLADLQNHGALVVGAFVDYAAHERGVDFLHPRARLELNGRDVFEGAGTNPAGDPRRLLPWLVEHCWEQDIALPAGTVVTAGSYTGMYFPKEAGTVVGSIAGLPPVRFEIV